MSSPGREGFDRSPNATKPLPARHQPLLEALIVDRPPFNWRVSGGTLATIDDPQSLPQVEAPNGDAPNGDARAPRPSAATVTVGGRKIRLRTVADRVPTRWFGAIATGVVLAITAAFGGLQPARGSEVPLLAVGEAYTNDEASITVERVVFADSVDEVSVGADRRAIVVVLTVTNRWDQPLSSWASGVNSIVDNVHLGTKAGSQDTTDRVDRAENLEPGTSNVKAFRTDDLTDNPYLQPDVPARLALVWPVGGDVTRQLSNGEELVITINDLTLIEPNVVYSVDHWAQPTPAARVVVAPEVVAAISVGDLHGTSGAAKATDDPGSEATG